MSVFESYAEEVTGLLRQAQEETPQGARFEELVEAAKEMLDQMEMEARMGGSREEKEGMRKTVAEQRRALAEMEDGARREQNRNALFEGKTDRNRREVMENVEKIEKQNETLSRVQRTVAECEANGEAISGELARNREVMEGIHERVHETNSLVDGAAQILDRMTNRMKSWGLYSGKGKSISQSTASSSGASGGASRGGGGGGGSAAPPT